MICRREVPFGGRKGEIPMHLLSGDLSSREQRVAFSMLRDWASSLYATVYAYNLQYQVYSGLGCSNVRCSTQYCAPNASAYQSRITMTVTSYGRVFDGRVLQRQHTSTLQSFPLESILQSSFRIRCPTTVLLQNCG